MPYCESSAISAKQPFRRSLDAIDYQDMIIICPNCASEDVEERFFYTVAKKKSA